jgi:hypothetical protein
MHLSILSMRCGWVSEYLQCEVTSGQQNERTQTADDAAAEREEERDDVSQGLP